MVSSSGTSCDFFRAAVDSSKLSFRTSKIGADCFELLRPASEKASYDLRLANDKLPERLENGA
jgi:hypothetical protein